MADPLKDNTQSTGKLTEAIDALRAAFQDELARRLAQQPQPATLYKPNAGLPPPPPQQTPAPPRPTQLQPPAPPVNNQTRIQLPPPNPTPPPPPPANLPIAQPAVYGPPAPKLHGTVSELESRLAELKAAYQSGAGPKDIATQTLRGRVKEQESFLGQQYASLSPQEQQQHAGVMKQLEQRRKEVEEEELRRRKALNQEMSHGERITRDFVGNLARGTPLGMGMGGGLAGGLGALFAEGFRRDKARMEHGGQEAFPVQHRQVSLTRDLADMEEAIRGRSRERMTAESQMNLARREALRQNALPLGTDPMKATGIGAWHIGALALGAGAYGYLRHGFNPEAADEYRANIYRRFYEERIKHAGGTPPDYRQLNMRTQVNPLPGVSAGYTTALGYQSELQTGILNTSTLESEKYQRVIQLLEDIGGILRDSDRNNTNGLERLRPAWQ